MEFVTSGEDVWYQTSGGIRPLREDSDIIPVIIDRIKDLYPRAYEKLSECYANSSLNVSYFNFLVVRRFCKCNFGALDHTKVDVGETFNFERIPCPLRGECRYEGVICMPKLETCLSEAEKRVMRLVCEGKNNAEIAEELYLSPNTVKRHISASYIKSHTRNRAEFIKYSNDNNMFV